MDKKMKVRIGIGAAIAVPAVLLMPVSYTHLDVYKRQDQKETSDGACQAYVVLFPAHPVQITNDGGCLLYTSCPATWPGPWRQ